jgi:biopolymer transport protein TolQ
MMMDLLTVLPFASIARSMPSLFTGAGVFAKIILLLLFVISIITWAIMWDRTRLYLRLRANGNALRKAASGGMAAIMSGLNRFLPSIEGAILVEARHHVESQESVDSAGRLVVDSPAEEEVARAKLREVLERRALNEISGMERHLIFLSTTASAAPFLGLLGTVWGIMSSFLSMGAQGSASIEVVGPGIAEALVTTIAGLASAIPALIGYNLLVRQVHRKETIVDLFISRAIEYFIVSRGAAAAQSASPRRERSEASLL